MTWNQQNFVNGLIPLKSGLICVKDDLKPKGD